SSLAYVRSTPLDLLLVEPECSINFTHCQCRTHNKGSLPTERAPVSGRWNHWHELANRNGRIDHRIGDRWSQRAPLGAGHDSLHASICFVRQWSRVDRFDLDCVFPRYPALVVPPLTAVDVSHPDHLPGISDPRSL